MARGFHARVVQHEVRPSGRAALSLAGWAICRKLIFESEIRHYHSGKLTAMTEPAKKPQKKPRRRLTKAEDRTKAKAMTDQEDARKGPESGAAACRLRRLHRQGAGQGRQGSRRGPRPMLARLFPEGPISR